MSLNYKTTFRVPYNFNLYDLAGNVVKRKFDSYVSWLRKTEKGEYDWCNQKQVGALNTLFWAGLLIEVD